MKTAEETAAEFIGADALFGIGYKRDYEIALAAIQYDRAQRVPEVAQELPTFYATDQHWEVSREEDEAGKWVYLQINRDDPDDLMNVPPVVNLSLSDHEARILAGELTKEES